MVTGKNNDPNSIDQVGFSKSQSGRCHLALSCTGSDLSMCITDIYDNKHLHFGKYKINDWNTDFEPVFRKAFGKTTQFKKASAMVWSPRNTLIPEGMYTDQARENFFRFEFGDVRKIDVGCDYIDGIKAYNIFQMDSGMEELLSAFVPNIRIKHHQSILIELLSRMQKISNDTKAYIHVQENHFDLVIFEKNSLKFANIFEYKSPEDFIYFLLLAFEELELQFRETSLIFLGKFDEEGDLYPMVMKYSDEVQWIGETKYYSASPDIRDVMDHENFLLFNQVVCAS